MNVENEEEYFDAIPNLPPIYTGMTSVVMPKPTNIYTPAPALALAQHISLMFFIYPSS